MHSTDFFTFYHPRFTARRSHNVELSQTANTSKKSHECEHVPHALIDKILIFSALFTICFENNPRAIPVRVYSWNLKNMVSPGGLVLNFGRWYQQDNKLLRCIEKWWAWSHLMQNRACSISFSIFVSACYPALMLTAYLFFISELILLYIYWHSDKLFCQLWALNLKLLASPCALPTSIACCHLWLSLSHTPAHTQLFLFSSHCCESVSSPLLSVSSQFPSLKVKSSITRSLSCSHQIQIQRN